MGQGVGEANLRSGIWTRGVVSARWVFFEVGVREMGYSGAEMAPFLGVTTSSVNRVTVSEILLKVRNYLNALSSLRISHLRPAFESSPGYLGGPSGGNLQVRTS